MGYSPQVKRMLYIQQTHEQLFSYVFADRKKMQNEALEQIAADNQVLLNAVSPSFIYDGKWYPEHVGKATKEIRRICNRELHTSLREKVQEILKADCFDDQTTQFGIRTLLGNVLMLAKHKQDLVRLLPTDLLQAISPIDEALFNVEDPLSDDAIESFMETNKANFGYLRRLVITRLLLARR